MSKADVKKIALIAAVALASIWAANNVQAIGNLTAPKS